MGSVTAPERATDSVEMCKILFGADFVRDNTVMTSLININSPMVFDDIMMGAMEVYAKKQPSLYHLPIHSRRGDGARVRGGDSDAGIGGGSGGGCL